MKSRGVTLTIRKTFLVLGLATLLLAATLSVAWGRSDAAPLGPQATTALSWVNRTTADGLGGNGVSAVFADDDEVYAATFSYGLSLSSNGGLAFTTKTTADGLGNNTVRGVYAANGVIYAATSGGLSLSNDGGNTFTNRTTADGLGHNSVYGVYANGSTVYAATYGGLSISTNGGLTFTNRTTSNGLGSNYVYGVYVTDNVIYVATSNGLSISIDDGNTFSTKRTPAGLGSSNVRGVYVTGSTVYAATANGLAISTDGGDTFSNRTTVEGLGSNDVKGVHASTNAIYAATSGGLSKSVDGTFFSNETTADGLGSNSVNGVYFDGGVIYAATSGGLSIADETLTSFVEATKSVFPEDQARYHEVITYTLTFVNSGLGADSGLAVDDVLPAEVDFEAWITQPAGASVNNDVVSWSGTLPGCSQLILAFTARHTGAYGDVVTNTAYFTGTAQTGQIEATFDVRITAAGTYAELVDAINVANLEPAFDVITLTDDITLTGHLPLITGDTLFAGDGHVIDGDGQYRVFFVGGTAADAAPTVTFENMTIQNGLAKGGNGGVGEIGHAGGGAGMGGGMFVYDGDITIRNVTFTHNAAIGGDGGDDTGSSIGGGGGMGGDGGDGGDYWYDGGGGGGGGLWSSTDGGDGGTPTVNGGDSSSVDGFGGGGGGGGYDDWEGDWSQGGSGLGSGGDGGDGNGDSGSSGGWGGGGGGGGGWAAGGSGGFGAGGGAAGGDSQSSCGGDGGFGGAGTSIDFIGDCSLGGFGGGGVEPGEFAGLGGAGLGGGLFVRAGDLHLQSVSFISNTATNGTDLSGSWDGQGKGGGLFVLDTLTNREDWYGSYANNQGMPDRLPVIIASNLTFSDNLASDEAGTDSDNNDYYYDFNLMVHKSVTPDTGIPYHSTVTYTIILHNNTLNSDTAWLTDSLPSEVDFAGWIEQPTGAGESGDEITWNSILAPWQTVTFTFQATHVGNYSDVVTNTAQYRGAVSDGDAEAVFTVIPALPNAQVSPTSLDVTVGEGLSETVPLTISNTGVYTLDYTLLSTGFSKGEVLVVDQDNAAATALENALTALGYTFQEVSGSTFVNMSEQDQLAYQAVFWVGYLSYNYTFDLADYLDAGGQLFVAYYNLGADCYNTTFYQNYLQASYISTDSGIETLVGQGLMSGIDPDISSGYSPDDFTVRAEGQRIFQFTGGNAAGVSVARNGYRAIYLSFNFDDVASAAHRQTIVERALAFMPGEAAWLSMTPTQGALDVSDEQQIAVTFDASVVTETGVYTGDILVISTDPDEPLITAPARMTVERLAPPDCYPSATTGAWSVVFAHCSPGAKYIIPVTATVTLDTNVAFDGDLEVAGTFDASNCDYTFTLTGSNPQTLKGNPLSFCRLTVDKTNKTDTVTIDGKLKVTKKLTIKKGKLKSASDYGDIHIETDGVLELTSDISVGGTFTNDGELIANTFTIAFDGAALQTLTGTSVTAFYRWVISETARVFIATTPTVTDTLENYGVVSQTQTVNNATVSFLQISTDKYQGVGISTTDALGQVSVAVSGNHAQCTDDPASGPYRDRCFRVTAGTGSTNTDMTFYSTALEDDVDNDQVFHWEDVVGSMMWVALDTTYGGTDGGACTITSDALTLVAGDNFFLIGDESEDPPTAVALRGFAARGGVWGMSILSVLAAGLVLFRRRKRA